MLDYTRTTRTTFEELKTVFYVIRESVFQYDQSLKYKNVFQTYCFVWKVI